MFKSITHVLNWAIDSVVGCQSIKVVEIDVLTMGQHRELSKKHKDEDLLRACVCASTGLTVADIKRLVTPDFNSIQENVLELMNATAAKLVGSVKFNLDEPALLVPFVGDDGVEKKGYKLRPPTVEITDLMDAHKDEWERTMFISASCSGFSQKELESMSLPDWNQLQECLIDFLQESADYFRPKT